MSLTLGPLYKSDLHEKPWCGYGTKRGTPGCPRFDYRITAGYLDRDILNGGIHRAVDAGNASTEWPVYSPSSAPMRHLHHFDGARGREWDLGNGWSFQGWHFAADPEDPPKPDKGTRAGLWQSVQRGQRVATTGNTGADLPDGSPMPPHTHWVLSRYGVAVDPEPYLYIDGKPGMPIEGAIDDMATFTDVPEGHRFYADIEWLAQQGITTGIPNGDGTFRFEPDSATARGEMAAFLHRLHDQIIDEVES